MFSFLEWIRRKWQLKHPDAMLREWMHKGAMMERAKWEAMQLQRTQLCPLDGAPLTQTGLYTWECLLCKARNTDPILQSATDPETDAYKLALKDLIGTATFPAIPGEFARRYTRKLRKQATKP